MCRESCADSLINKEVACASQQKQLFDLCAANAALAGSDRPLCYQQLHDEIDYPMTAEAIRAKVEDFKPGNPAPIIPLPVRGD